MSKSLKSVARPLSPSAPLGGASELSLSWGWRSRCLKKGTWALNPIPVKDNILSLDVDSRHQAQLVWEKGPQNILIIKKHYDPTIENKLVEVSRWLAKLKKTIFVEDAIEVDEVELLKFDPKDGSQRIDLCIALGGDGTLLHLNSLFQTRRGVPPCIAFGLGSLGFLTPLVFAHHREHLTRILTPKLPFSVVLRMRLSARVFRGGASVPSSVFRFHALNEVLVGRGSSTFISKLELSVDKNFVTMVQADGIIVASPTGSTAYSMSAGGSMTSPSLSAILLTPICPHTLGFRPLVLPESAIVDLVVPASSRHGASVSFDGRNDLKLERGDRVEIRMSPYPFPTYATDSNSFSKEWFNSIKAKLGWNIREIGGDCHTADEVEGSKLECSCSDCDPGLNSREDAKQHTITRKKHRSLSMSTISKEDLDSVREAEANDVGLSTRSVSGPLN